MLTAMLATVLFMGTADYPDENSWAQFLSAHGGEDNGAFLPLGAHFIASLQAMLCPCCADGVLHDHLHFQ